VVLIIEIKVVLFAAGQYPEFKLLVMLFHHEINNANETLKCPKQREAKNSPPLLIMCATRNRNIPLNGLTRF